LQRDARTNAQVVQHIRQVENLETSTTEKSGMQRLVDLFPRATPMRILISVTVSRGKGQGLEENSAIECGTDKVVFFESCLPLELGDKFHLQNSDGSLEADAFVVGLHFIGGRRAIAGRFAAEFRNWILEG
jgi:hypothetical protein